MKCLNPSRITKNIDSIKYPQGIEVPCGQCMNCRILKRDEWVLRVLHESQGWDSCIFFTLTYSEKHLPKDKSIHKSDLQNFFKRLRKKLYEESPKVKTKHGNWRDIKYFACGDYGETNGRPHYHVIMFGLDYLDKNDIELIKSCWTLCDWKMQGKKPFGDVSKNSIRYVAGYVEKKVIGREEEYAYEGIEKPFILVSKGMGKDYCLDNIDKVIDGYFELQGRKKPVPRYYRKISGVQSNVAEVFGKERESEVVESVLDVFTTRDDLYITGTAEDVMLVEDAIRASNIQHDKNIKARIAMKKRVIKKGL